MNRHRFLTSSLLATTAIVTAPFVRAQPITAEDGRGPGRGPRTDLRPVLDFVQAAHRDLDKVQTMLATDPSLAIASWDWGNGDWETGLEGAAHMGRRDIVRYLLDHGARADSFSAAMLGHTATVAAMIGLTPATAITRGPHGLPLMFYVGHGGQPAMAEVVVPHLTNVSGECNRAIHTATLSNHIDLVAWLLKNGADNPNTKNFFGKTPLDAALDRDFTDLAKLLRQNGGKTSG